MIARFVFWLVAMSLVVGCQPSPKSSKGFSLPDGDPVVGEKLFRQFQCYECHSIAGVEMPQPEDATVKIVRLGGKVGQVKTYGELVTSIINPSHRLARGYVSAQTGDEEEQKSPMRNYSDEMTVSELIDIVAFLQSHYELMQYEPTHYPLYY